MDQLSLYALSRPEGYLCRQFRYVRGRLQLEAEIPIPGSDSYKLCVHEKWIRMRWSRSERVHTMMNVENESRDYRACVVCGGRVMARAPIASTRRLQMMLYYNEKVGNPG
jgi:hypothetical protein